MVLMHSFSFNIFLFCSCSIVFVIYKSLFFLIYLQTTALWWGMRYLCINRFKTCLRSPTTIKKSTANLIPELNLFSLISAFTFANKSNPFSSSLPFLPSSYLWGPPFTRHLHDCEWWYARCWFKDDLYSSGNKSKNFWITINYISTSWT